MAERALLASDLDGTLIPAEPAPAHVEALEHLGRGLATHPEIVLAYVTGRRWEMVEQAIRWHRLPRPDFVACDVGTSVYVRRDGRLVRDDRYDELMRSAAGGLTGTDVRAALADLDGLELQDEESQGEHKTSYIHAADRRAEVVGTVEQRLAGRAVSIVSSTDPYSGTGLLDILPAGVAKHTAVRYVGEQTDLAGERVLYAGDSGNDLAPMLDGYRVTVVANASQELTSELRRRMPRLGIEDRIYFAENPSTAGVLEGCTYWRLFA